MTLGKWLASASVSLGGPEIIHKCWGSIEQRIGVTLKKITEKPALSNYFIMEQVVPDQIQPGTQLCEFVFLDFQFQVTAEFYSIHSIKPPSFVEG